MSGKTQPNICFLCGIRKRTGTNYLYDLLSKHPQCAHTGPTEDWILHYGNLLETFANRIYLVWHEELQAQRRSEKTSILRAVGHGLEAFLVERAAKCGSEQNDNSIILTKTPSAYGLQLAPRLFPTSRVIILVRDGRAVVESAKKTWGLGIDFDEEALAWARGARTALNLSNEEHSSRWLVVRYEDLVVNTESELRRIFRFLDLPESDYDFAQIEKQIVIGSSQFRNQGKRAELVKMRNPRSFVPLDRFKHWKPRQHWRFRWLAGDELRELGYEVPESAAGCRYEMYNVLSDVWGSVRRPLRRVLHAFVITARGEEIGRFHSIIKKFDRVTANRGQ